jgi:lauroyl/myristoyl acyltransferase
MRGLRSGDLVVLLPDQVPEGSASRIDAPFFGRKAKRCLLLKRLIRSARPRCLWLLLGETPARAGCAIEFVLRT